MENVVEASGADTLEVSAVELLEDTGNAEPSSEPAPQEPAPQETSQEATQEPPQAAAAKTYTQQEFDAAVRARAQHIERGYKQKVESDPYYRLGKQFTEMKATMIGKRPEEALLDVQHDFLSQQASALAQDPEAMARTMLNMQIPVQQPVDPENIVAQRIADEMQQYAAAGVLPQGFDMRATVASNPQFLRDCAEHGVGVALHRLNSMQQKAAQQSALPQSGKPKFNEAAPKQVDYTNMSAEDFAKIQARTKQRHLEGYKVKF